MSVSTLPVPSARQPHDIPLPRSPEKPPRRQRPKKGKGKEDAARSSAHAPGRPQESAAESSGVSNEPEESPWAWASLTDSGASRHPPVVSQDGSYFFSVVGSSVKIHSCTTGEVVSTLSASPSGSSAARPADGDGHTDLITSAILSPDNPFQLITSSLDGCIKVWDYLDAVLLQTIDLSQPIFRLCAHENFRGYVFVSVGRSTKKTNKRGVPIEDNASVLRVSLKPTPDTTESPRQKSSETISLGKTRYPLGLGISASGKWLVAIGGHKAYVAQTAALKAGFTKFVSPERLTCLAFHPFEDYFATGDDKGNIRSWFCLREDLAQKTVGVEKRAQTTTLHWHAHAVSTLAFTTNGAYLLSGGEEAVLVIWQLHTGKKEFVPRVGAPINSVTLVKHREEEYLLALADASHVVVSSTALKVMRAFSRIKLDPSTPEPSASTSNSVPLAIHSRTGTLILPSSHPSSLQAYSPSTSKVTLELEVSSSNRVSRRDEAPIEPSRVQSAAIAVDGDWMATIDSREGDDTFRGEICLKIWWWDWKAGVWSLNTRVDRPHGLKKVTSLSFSPTSNTSGAPHLVTTGEDGLIKTWRLRSTKNKKGEAEDFWVTRSTFTFRSLVPSHASWSSDGSVLVASLGPYVILYDPSTGAVLKTLTCSECKVVVSSHFVGRSGRYLAVVGRQDVVLWDLLSESIRWHYRVVNGNIQSLVPHARDETFAVLLNATSGSDASTLSTRVLVFRPASSTPHRIHTLPFRLRNIAWHPSSSASRDAFTLVAVTHIWSVVLVGDDVQLPADEGAAPREISRGAVALRPTIFQDIFGSSAFAGLTAESQPRPSTSTLATPNGTSGNAGAIFDAPAYLLPPVSTLFDALMADFATVRPDGEVEEDERRLGQGSDADEDEMDVEEAVVLVGKKPQRVVDRGEMDMFVALFRDHAVRASPPPQLPRAAAKPNGVHHPQVNGKSAPTAIPKPNGIHTKSKVASPAVVPSSPSVTAGEGSPIVAIGKKRKKSLG